MIGSIASLIASRSANFELVELFVLVAEDGPDFLLRRAHGGEERLLGLALQDALLHRQKALELVHVGVRIGRRLGDDVEDAVRHGNGLAGFLVVPLFDDFRPCRCGRICGRGSARECRQSLASRSCRVLSQQRITPALRQLRPMPDQHLGDVLTAPQFGQLYREALGALPVDHLDVAEVAAAGHCSTPWRMADHFERD
jgi:hypothetical protein